MKAKLFWAGLLLITGIIVGSDYLLHWQPLKRPVIAQPSGEAKPLTTEAAKSAEPAESAKAIKPTKPSESTEAPEAGGKITLLVLGTDNMEKEVGRSDSIMFISANLDTHQVAVISIPRDTRVKLAGVGLTKIAHANVVGELKGGSHAGTMECAQAVSTLLGVPINYYLKLDVQGFVKAVDAVGGVEVNLPTAVNDHTLDLHLAPGVQHLSGNQALLLAQARYGLPNGDFDRQLDQFYILSALASQLLRVSSLPKLPDVWQAVCEDLLDTNLTMSEMARLGLEFKGLDSRRMRHFHLPGQGISALDPLVGAKVYYYEPDQEGVSRVVREATEGPGIP